MITFHHLSKTYADKTILSDVSATINSGDHIALIGKNGAGKTTLLRLLQGLVEADNGAVQSTEVIGCVEQIIREQHRTIRESFADDSWRIDVALAQVGLDAIPTNIPINQLSGGQKTRLSFAHVLAANPEPTVLLLDEPTNNLDAEGLEWLCQFVADFKGGVLVASHDRAFINKVTQHIWELDDGALTIYGGNYDTYKQDKLHQNELRQKYYEENIAERKKVAQLIRKAQVRAARGVRDQRARDNDKFLKAYKNTQVQNSLGGQAKALQSRLDKLEEVDRPDARHTIRLGLQGSVHVDKLILKISELSKTLGGRQLFAGVSFEIRGNERVLVTGKNGAGKTTLFKLAMQEAEPEHIQLGTGVRIGYFAQDVYGLDADEKPLEVLRAAGADATQAHVLARQLGIDATGLRKRVGELSRGQQAKLGLVRLLFGDYDLLILDEPTNHLDIETREALERALLQYKGAILFASHDVYFQQLLQPNRTIYL